MSGIIQCIYAQRDLNGDVLDAVDCVLATSSAPLVRTRKSRVWNCRIDDRPVTVRIEVTARVLDDFEDELAALGLLPGQAPFLVVLDAACSTDEDSRVIESLAVRISQVVDGVVGRRQC